MRADPQQSALFHTTSNTTAKLYPLDAPSDTQKSPNPTNLQTLLGLQVNEGRSFIRFLIRNEELDSHASGLRRTNSTRTHARAQYT
jgi:hypothetical protein